MPQLHTKYFGPLEYQEQDVVRFPSGLPAFEEESRFLVIEPPDRAPLAFLQSMRQPGLCFLALPVLSVEPRYGLAITTEDLEALKLDTGRQPAIGAEVDCLVVIAIPEGGVPSANLLAPIVINRANRLGTQAIRVDSTYSHQHPVAKVEDACS